MDSYRIHDQQGLNHPTLTTVGWADVFARQCYRDILVDSLEHCQEDNGLVACGYVVMSNHVHLIAQTQGHELSDVLRDFRKFTSKAIIKVRAGWVAQPEHWLYSSATDYMGGKGLLEVSTVEPIEPVLPLNW